MKLQLFSRSHSASKADRAPSKMSIPDLTPQELMGQVRAELKAGNSRSVAASHRNGSTANRNDTESNNNGTEIQNGKISDR